MENRMLCFALALFLGMLSAYFIQIPIIYLIVLILFLASSLFFFRKNLFMRMVIFILIIVSFGIFEYNLVAERGSQLKDYDDEELELDIVILEDGGRSRGAFRYLAEVREVYIHEGRQAIKEKILLIDYNQVSYKVGDRVKVRGSLSKFMEKRNFGDRDLGSYYRSRGIYRQFASRNSYKEANLEKSLKVTFFYKVRSRIAKNIDKALPQEEAAFLKAIILGDKNHLHEEVKDNYAKAGLSHLLSISGLHVGLIAFMLNSSLKLVKLKDRVRNIIATAFLGYYVLMIGAPPPALRAFIMILILIWGKSLGRDYDMIAGASFAALVMLLFNPFFIHSPGFIISFACIYSIGFLYDKVYDFLGKFIFYEYFKKAMALSLSVQLGIGPILIYYFNYLSLVNILLNIIAIPMVFVILAAGFLGVVLGSFLPFLGLYIFSIDYYFISLLTWITKVGVSLPFSGFYIPSLPLFFYLLYYGILGVIIFDESRLTIYSRGSRNYILGILFIFFLIGLGGSLLPRSLRMVFIDVGQGDSTLITTSRGKNILIDGGGSLNRDEYYYDIGGKITVPALLKLGVGRIDTIMVSHIHEDHMEGLLQVLEVFKVKRAVLPKTPYCSETSERFLDLCKAKDVAIIYAKAGDSLSIDKDTEIDIIFPEEELVIGEGSQENNNSLVAKLRYKDFSALFTGDIEGEAERYLEKKDIGADVLKVPHHGSKTSSTIRFMESVSPEISIISVGKNSFGHPSEEALSRINSCSSWVLRTDELGAIDLRIKDRGVAIKTVRDLRED